MGLVFFFCFFFSREKVIHRKRCGSVDLSEQGQSIVKSRIKRLLIYLEISSVQITLGKLDTRRLQRIAVYQCQGLTGRAERRPCGSLPTNPPRSFSGCHLRHDPRKWTPRILYGRPPSGTQWSPSKVGAKLGTLLSPSSANSKND